jgi:cobalt/nickel transport protein
MSWRVWTFCLIVLGLALLLAALSPLASSRPDGLERVVEDHGPGKPGESAKPPGQGHAPMPDYRVPGVGGEAWASILAGLVGTLAVFGVALGLGWLISSRRKPPSIEGKPGETSTPR